MPRGTPILSDIRERASGSFDSRFLPLLPAVGFVVVFLIVPLAYLAYISVHPFDPIEIIGQGLTGENYVRFLGDQFYLNYVLYTVRIALIVTLLCVLLGYPAGYYVAKTTPRRRSIAMLIIVLPLMAGLVVRIYGWLRIFGETGVLNRLWLVVFDSPLNILNTTSAVIIGLVGVLVPFVILPVYSSIEGIDGSLERAARNLGANEFYVLWKIILPLSLPGLVLGSVFAFTLSMSSVITPLLLGGRTDVTIGALMYDVSSTDSNWPFASSMAVTIIILNLLLIFLYFRISRGRLEVNQ